MKLTKSKTVHSWISWLRLEADLSVSDPLFDLSKSLTGREPESLFPSKFLQWNKCNNSYSLILIYMLRIYSLATKQDGLQDSQEGHLR